MIYIYIYIYIYIFRLSNVVASRGTLNATKENKVALAPLTLANSHPDDYRTPTPRYPRGYNRRYTVTVTYMRRTVVDPVLRTPVETDWPKYGDYCRRRIHAITKERFVSMYNCIATQINAFLYHAITSSLKSEYILYLSLSFSLTLQRKYRATFLKFLYTKHFSEERHEILSNMWTIRQYIRTYLLRVDIPSNRKSGMDAFIGNKRYLICNKKKVCRIAECEGCKSEYVIPRLILARILSRNTDIHFET